MTLRELVRGVLGVTRYATGAGRASAQLQRNRLTVCAACPERDAGRDPDGLLDRCGACGCFLVAKSGLAGESCPRGKW